jgi:hypothetical protein
MERFTHNMLFHWFIGRSTDAPVWPHPGTEQIDAGSAVHGSHLTRLPPEEAFDHPVPHFSCLLCVEHERLSMLAGFAASR